MMRNAVMAAVLVLALPAMAHAEARPRSGSHDSRVTYASWQDGQVYTVQTRVRNVTLIELGDGETIRSIAIGDSEAFQVDKLEGSNVFTVKPVIAGASTNLTVETNRRFYFINVVETGKGTPQWSVKFSVPGTRSGASRQAALVPALTPMSYAVLGRNGSAKFRPIGVSDDGRKTRFQIPAGAPIPAVFRADDKGREYSVNSTVDGTIITVGSLSERWVLRYGDEYVCIEATKPEGR